MAGEPRRRIALSDLRPCSIRVPEWELRPDIPVQQPAEIKKNGVEVPRGSRPDLALILVRVAERDQDAFAKLYHATKSKLYGIVVYIVDRPSLADEIIQEVYLRIWERATEYRPELASPMSWMMAIARNQALDQMRRMRSRLIVPMTEDFDIISQLDNALEQMEHNAELRTLFVCLNRLEPDKREMVLLAYCRGVTREALSKRYGRPIATIKTWLRRSLVQLRLCITE